MAPLGFSPAHPESDPLGDSGPLELGDRPENLHFGASRLAWLHRCPGETDKRDRLKQLRQRAAMGGEKERAELAAFESLMAKAIADALVAELREEAATHGVDVWTWLAGETKKDDQDF